jgi:hypothetical protein
LNGIPQFLVHHGALLARIGDPFVNDLAAVNALPQEVIERAPVERAAPELPRDLVGRPSTEDPNVICLLRMRMPGRARIVRLIRRRWHPDGRRHNRLRRYGCVDALIEALRRSSRCTH